MQKDKPQLKAIGSIVGIGGRKEIRHYLGQQFAKMGFQADPQGAIDLARYRGTFEGQEMLISFRILKRSKYAGLNQDHQFRYRTFQGIRVSCAMPIQQKTRMLIVTKTEGKWHNRITNWIMRWRDFQTINKDYLGKEVYSPDKLFAQAFINDSQASNNLRLLSSKESKILSWGVVVIPGQLSFNSTFANLDEFEELKLQKRLSALGYLAKAIENKPITQELSLRKSEILARDPPKKLMWRSLWLILLYILLCVLLIALLFFITVKFGQWPIIIMGTVAYIIYKKV